MNIFKRFMKKSSSFFQSLKSDNKRELLELEKLEKKLEKQKEHEKKALITPFVFTNRMFIKFRVFGLLVVFLGLLVYQSLNIIYLIFMAYIISLAVEAVIDFFHKKIGHRTISIIIAYILLLLAFLWAMVFIIPFILGQISDIITIFIGNISNFQEVLTTKSLTGIIQDIHRLPWSLKTGLLNSLGDPTVVAGVQNQLEQNIAQMVSVGTTYAKNIGTMAVSAVWSIATFFTQTSIVLTLSVLFSFQKDAVMKFIARLGGQKKYKFIYMKIEKIYKQLGVRLKSQLMLCLFMGVAMYAILWILALFGLDLPQKWALAGIVAITELIPYIGPFIGGAAAALVAFIHFWRYGALIVIGCAMLLQWLENNVLIPLLMNKTLGVNPIVIFISMIIWGLILGFLGILLAVPIAVIVTLLMEKTFEE